MKAEHDLVMATLEAGYVADRVHAVGAVPASPATPYLDVAVAPGTPVNHRNASGTPARRFRAVVRAFGKSVAEVAFAAQKAEDALLEQRIGAAYSPCRREVASPPMRDADGGGLLMVVHTYTFNKHA